MFRPIDDLCYNSFDREWSHDIEVFRRRSKSKFQPCSPGISQRPFAYIVTRLVRPDAAKMGAGSPVAKDSDRYACPTTPAGGGAEVCDPAAAAPFVSISPARSRYGDSEPTISRQQHANAARSAKCRGGPPESEISRMEGAGISERALADGIEFGVMEPNEAGRKDEEQFARFNQTGHYVRSVFP
jgi:hypothetical protein